MNAAVAELDSHPPDVSRPIVARRRWRLILVGAVLSVIAAGGLAYARARATPALTTMERGLGCLSAGDAEELLRPIVSSTGTLAFRQGLQGAGTVLRVEGTPEQLRQVNSALDRHQASGAGACSSGTPSLPVP